MLYALGKYVFIGPFLRLFFPCQVIGAEYIPETGGAILAGNHVAVADSFFTPLHIKRRVTYLAKAEYFTEKGFKGRMKKWFFSGHGPGADRPRAELRGTRRADDRGPVAYAMATCSASIPKAPDRLTGGSTRARPA